MLRQSLQQKLLQKLSPQQIQLMKLLQVPTAELETRIKEELEVNPALEEGKEDADTLGENGSEEEDLRTEGEKEFELDDYWDDDTPDYKLNVQNRGKDDLPTGAPMVMGKSLLDSIREQFELLNLSEQDKVIGFLLIGNLDESGYLRRSVTSLVDDLVFQDGLEVSEDDILDILFRIQELDPAGIGARNLQECLIIQLERKEITPEVLLAIQVLEKCFDQFTKKHYSKIMQKLGISEANLKEALDEILKLNPKPGGGYNSGGTVINQQVMPDFLLVEKEDGTVDIQMFQSEIPDLKISRGYKEMMKGYSENPEGARDKEAIQFIKQKIESAHWFIDAIKQRQITLLTTMRAILDIQREFFKSGDETKLKPMILKDVAERVGLDVSTISRVANSKYIQTPYGNYLLKYFFSEALTSSDGEEVSSREVKKILEESIAAENKAKPLTDEKLRDVLKEQGYELARRTVAKYREQLGIPVARLRKQLL